MTISERVQEVFQRFNVNLTVTEEPRTELAEAVLENGTVIYTDADDFDEGAEAYIINDEGERIPLPQGDYTLQDGSVLKIADGGKVAGVEGKGNDGKEGRDGKVGPDGKADGNAPKTRENAPAKEAPANDAPSKEAPAKKKPAPKKPAPGKKLAQEEPNDMQVQMNEEQVLAMLVDRFPDLGEEVAAQIAAAVAEIYAMPEEVVEEEVEAKDKDKEEMSAQEPQEDLVAVELAAIKAELEAMKKQAADAGLKHAAPTPKAEPVDLTNLSTSERVNVLLNQFSK